MPWGAVAIGGSALLGYAASSSASKAQSQSAGEATQAQRDIADQQTALQREQYLKQLELNEPFRQGGLTGQNMLLAQLQGPYGSAKFGGVPGYDPASAMKDFGGVAGYDPASAMRNFGASDFQADPGYAFRLSEGTKALDRTAASRGGLLSGAALKGAQRYGQDLASQEYQNAFNRYQINRSNQLNPLQSLMGTGQTATGQDIASGTNYAGNVGNALGAFGAGQASNIIGAGNARASGYVGGANAISSGLGQGLNFYQNQNYLNNLNLARNPNAYGYGMTNAQPAGVTSGNPVYYDF